MGRYLTPGRICVLTLIETYLCRKSSIAASLVVLELIAQQIVLVSESENIADDEISSLSDGETSLLAKKLQQCPSDIPGRSMYENLLGDLWGFDDHDSFNLLFDRLDNFVKNSASENSSSLSRISRTAPLGQFIRRCCIEFTRLAFPSSLALWDAFVAYRSSCFQQPSTQCLNESLQLPPKPIDSSSSARHSILPDRQWDGQLISCAIDANALLTHTVHCLQSFGRRLPHDLKRGLEAWISHEEDTGTQSLHHFISFFDHWRAGQYHMALDSIHRYFDYSVATQTGDFNMRSHYQYALLHLSVLHADFECWDESFDAMSECIATSRENQDTACLNFALSWMLFLRHAHPHPPRILDGAMPQTVRDGDRDELTFLKAQAKEEKQWLILGSSLLEEARIELSKDGQMDRAQECIIQAMYLNVQHGLRTSMPATTMLYAASLERLGENRRLLFLLGQHHLAMRQYQAATVVHSNFCPLHDSVKATCRLAHTLARQGEFDQAIQVLQALIPVTKGNIRNWNRVTACLLLVQFMHKLQREEWQTAMHLLPSLRTVEQLGDSELSREVLCLNIELQIGLQNFEVASKKIDEWLGDLKNHHLDLALYLHLLILKAKAVRYKNSAEKSLSVMLRVCKSAEHCLVMPLLKDAIALLDKVLIEHPEMVVVI